MLTFETIDPRNPRSEKVDLIFPDSLVEKWQKEMPTRFWNLHTVVKILKNPSRIFSGLRSVNPGGWCYSGIPKSWYIKDGISVTFPKDLVYLVFVNAGLVVYNFRAEPSDKKDKYCPERWENRYGSLVWKNNP